MVNHFSKTYLFFLFFYQFLFTGTCVCSTFDSRHCVFQLFTDTLVDSCTPVIYNGATRVGILKDTKNKTSVLQLAFDDKAFTTVDLCLKKGKVIDLADKRSSAFIKFKVRGNFGGEQCLIGIADYDRNANIRTETKLRNTDYFDITTDWKEVVVPLQAFTSEGECWHEDKKASEYRRINWHDIASIRFSTEKEMNYGRSTDRIAQIFIDDLEIVVDSTLKQPARKFTPWRNNAEIIAGPPIEKSDSADTFFSWIDTRIAPLTSVYTYGYPTDYSIFDPVDSNHAAVFATFQNNMEWSGVALSRSTTGSINVTPWYKTGGIEFYVRGERGGELFGLGLLDDESDGIDRKVQSRISSRTIVKVTKEWQRVVVPFSVFENIGKWWNSDSHYEVVGTLDWSKISDVRFSVDQYADKYLITRQGEPIKIYFSNIGFLKKAEVVSNECFWENFSSSAPDKLIEDFNTYDVNLISKNIDSTSYMKISAAENPNDHSNAVNMEYKIGSWGSATYSLPENDVQKVDWSLHNAVSFDFFSSEKSQTGMLMLTDSGSEAWYAHFVVNGGWQKITVPFSRFRQFEWWQPEDAKLDGKMDMHHVRTFDWRPGVNGKKGTIILDNITITNNSSENDPSAKKIQINQVGYLPGFLKKFSVTDRNANTFLLKNSKDDVVLTGSLSKGNYWEPSGQYVKTGEFSGISQPGTYTITIQETGDSMQVAIKDTLGGILRDALRAFYYQRTSMDISEPFAGKFHHAGGHPDTAAIFHTTTNRSGTADVRGGWYDAGDYGKYIVNAGISCFRLLSLYELYPKLIGDDLNIPESKNSISDLLDEVRYEIEWFKRMQDSDGGVFFKVGTLDWDGFIMPGNATQPRYIIGKSTSSTLNFAATLAMAARIYRNTDKKFSKDCYKRAVAAWNWAIKNPSISQPDEAGGTGAYGDKYLSDEFFWAASELFTTTKKSVYKKFIEQQKDIPVALTSADWQSLGLCGYQTLVTHFSENEIEAVGKGNRIIHTMADSIIAAVDTTPYGVPSPEFSWGSNCYMLNNAVVCCYAYKQTGKLKYLNAVIDIVNYIFGDNATGYSFVTGYGSKSPLQPHHRIMGSDNINDPYPGFLVGGPNSNRQDEVANEPGVYYPYKQPARAYVDALPAYASNEICINWNAILVFVLGFVQMNK